MKEENKKTTAKKTAVKKSTAVKKTAAKKTDAKKATSAKKVAAKKTNATVGAKKATVKKVSVPKKTTSVKAKAVVKEQPKKVVAKKSVVNSVNEIKVEKKEIPVEKKEELNRTLIMRTILLITYTLIIIFLIIGFVDYLVNHNLSTSKPREISSYIQDKNVFPKSNIITLEDASFKLSALNGNYFVYITYTDAKVNAFEKDLAKLLDNKKIKDNFYYISIDKIKDEENAIELVNKYLNFKDALVSKVPTIVYVDSENIVRQENIISRLDDKMITINDVKSLLDRNGF